MYSHFIPIDLKEYTVSRTDTPLIKRLSSTGTLLNFEYRFHPQNTDFHRIFSLKKKKNQFSITPQTWYLSEAKNSTKEQSRQKKEKEEENKSAFCFLPRPYSSQSWRLLIHQSVSVSSVQGILTWPKTALHKHPPIAGQNSPHKRTA